MKKTIILIVFMSCIQGLWAQGISLHDGMYTEKWERERDEIANKPLYKPKVFNTPIDYNAVYRGIRVERVPTPTSTVKRTTTVSSAKSGYKTYSVGSHNNNKSHYGELRQQWAEEAKKKLRKRKGV